MTEEGSEIRWERVAGVSLHPTQLATLKLVAGPAPSEGWTVARMAKANGVPIHQQRHHVSILVTRGLLSIAARRPILGTGFHENQYGLSEQARSSDGDGSSSRPRTPPSHQIGGFHLADVIPLPTRLRREPFVDSRELAEHFGVHVRTIERWRGRGLPYVRIGPRAVRFQVSVCDQWARTQHNGGS